MTAVLLSVRSFSSTNHHDIPLVSPQPSSLDSEPSCSTVTFRSLNTILTLCCAALLYLTHREIHRDVIGAADSARMVIYAHA